MKNLNSHIPSPSLKLFLMSFLLLIFFSFSSFVLANENGNQSYDFSKNSGLDTTSGKAGYNTGQMTRPEIIIGNVIQVIISFVGVIFLSLMIYAGITWITAQGESEKTAKAKKLIEGSVSGLVIVAAAYIIVSFIINYFSK